MDQKVHPETEFQDQLLKTFTMSLIIFLADRFLFQTLYIIFWQTSLMRTMILTSLLMASSTVFCQDVFKKGYIVNNASDTVFGYIKDDLEERWEQAIVFRDDGGASKVLSVSDIKAFGFNQGPIFRLIQYVHPLETPDKQSHFAKLLMAGTYFLFSFREKDKLYFVVQSRDTSYLLYNDQTTQLGEVTEHGNYQNFLAFFGRECPKVSATAANVNYTEEAFISYFSSFEKCKGTFNTVLISYSKPKTEKYILVTAGAFAVDKRSEIFSRALIQFIWPGLSRKTSMNTGLSYSRHTDETSTTYSMGKIETKLTTELYELPLLVRYDFFEKRIRPYIYGGGAIGVKMEHETVTKVSAYTESFKSDDQSFGATVLLGCGISVSVSRNFLLNLDWHYDLLSHLPAFGIGYRSNKF